MLERHICYTFKDYDNGVKVTIIEQSQISRKFAKGNVYRCSNGFSLESRQVPTFYNWNEGPKTFFLWGTRTWRNDNELNMAASTFEKFKECIDEYNSYYKRKEKI